jgi:hypothetical protein
MLDPEFRYAEHGVPTVHLHDPETALTRRVHIMNSRSNMKIRKQVNRAKRPARSARNPRSDVAWRGRPARDAGLAASSVGIPRFQATYIGQALGLQVKETQQLTVSTLSRHLQTFPLPRLQQRSRVLCLAMRRIYHTFILSMNLRRLWTLV